MKKILPLIALTALASCSNEHIGEAYHQEETGKVITINLSDPALTAGLVEKQIFGYDSIILVTDDGFEFGFGELNPSTNISVDGGETGTPIFYRSLSN